MKSLYKLRKIYMLGNCDILKCLFFCCRKYFRIAVHILALIKFTNAANLYAVYVNNYEKI